MPAEESSSVETDIQPVQCICYQCLRGDILPLAMAVVWQPDPVLEEESAEPEPKPEQEPELVYGSIADTITDKEKGLLALLVYHESRGEPEVGQRAVVEVTLNRVLSADFPDTIRGVIYEKNAYSCSGYLTSAAVKEPASLVRAMEAVEAVLAETEQVLGKTCHFFRGSEPKTSDYEKIGNHYFY